MVGSLFDMHARARETKLLHVWIDRASFVKEKLACKLFVGSIKSLYIVILVTAEQLG